MEFKGLATALVTPFKADKSVDFTALENLIKHQIQGGVNFLVLMGTTSEYPVLTASEKQEIIGVISEVNNKSVPLVLGVGGNNTASVCEALKSVDERQISGILSASPYYNKPTQRGIFEHYKALSKVSKLPIMLYNVPGRTASNIESRTTLALAKSCDNIVAIKEASGNLEQIQEIVFEKPDGFSVLSGDDSLTLPMLSFGVEGVVSVMSNAYPTQMKQVLDAFFNGENSRAMAIQKTLFPMMQALFLEGNPAGVKYVLSKLGILENQLRLPLVGVSKETENILDEIQISF